MRLVSYAEAGAARFGAIVGERVVDLARASEALATRDSSIADIPAEIERFLDRADELTPSLKKVVALSAAGDARLSRPLAEVKLLQPVGRPTKIVCVARNYAEHAREAGLQVSEI